MEKVACTQCSKPKAQLICGICECSICKSCTQFVEENRFSFMAEVPKFLAHTSYCESCFYEKVQPEIENYDALMEKAKNISVFDKSQSKETRLIKRLEETVKVVNCEDRNETVLRLAFFAAQKNLNSLVDLETTSQKVKNGSYQTTIWSGSAVPTQVDDRKLLKDRSFWHQPN